MSRKITIVLDEADARGLPDLLDDTRQRVATAQRQANQPPVLRAAGDEYRATLARVAQAIREALRA